MAFDVEQEKDTHARADELAILRHAQRLKVIRGRDRALGVLAETMRDISAPNLLSTYKLAAK